MKTALAHDYLNQCGGAENVLKVLAEIFPEAPIYTLFYDEKKTRGYFKNRVKKTSFLKAYNQSAACDVQRDFILCALFYQVGLYGRLDLAEILFFGSGLALAAPGFPGRRDRKLGLEAW